MTWSLTCWGGDGQFFSVRLEAGRILSVGAVDADLVVPGLTKPIFVELTDVAPPAVQALLTSGEGDRGRKKAVKLKLGVPAEVHGFQWVLGAEEQMRATPFPQNSSSEGFYTALLDWAARPMDVERHLRESLQAFLSLLVSSTRARSGMLVLTEARGAQLVATAGLSASQAESLWANLPSDVVARIVKARARLILPEDLDRRIAMSSTVFLRGIKSVVGFSVIAEEKVLGIIFLGFENLLTELTEAMQGLAEDAATILGLVLQRGLLREQMQTLRVRVFSSSDCDEDRLLLGESLAMELVYRDLKKLAPTLVPILIQGETGTGKELAAREVHRLSNRRQGPFVAVNGASLPEHLVESELFGHRRGAFTGALSDRIGLIEQADGGTLFIDEIAEMPLVVQAKLLRTLQEKVVMRLGEGKPRPVDFRLVTATHAHLPDRIGRHLFREDLYYRIAGARIELPTLRARREDIVPLAQIFVRRCAKHYGLEDKEFSAEAMRALRAAPWAGNVRELQSTVERALVIADGAAITAGDLGTTFAVPPDDGGAPAVALAGGGANALATSKEEWLRGRVTEALALCDGNKAAAAKMLGVGRRTLFRYVEQLGIDVGARS